MLKRTITSVVTCLVLAGVSPLRADGTYPTDFGMAADLRATGNRMTVNYFGWEETTVYGHTLWAMTTDQYQSNLASGCFAWSDCSGRQGLAMFTKPFGATAFDRTTFGSTTFSVTNYFAPQEPVVFVLQVNQRDGFSWFFSGDPSRNSDGLAHLAFFQSGGVPVHPYNSEIVPGSDQGEIYGFEDVYRNESDWDFNNALFSIAFDNDPDHPWEDPTPEPATLTLLASGLVGLAATRRRQGRSRGR